MKLLLVSDTHCKNVAQVRQLVDLLRPFARDVEMILHAGDHVIPDVVDALEELAPTLAVRGNMDAFGESDRFPKKRVIEVGRFRVGLIHGDGPPKGLIERARAPFAGERLDAIVFGHSHSATVRQVEGVLMVNPGSPLDRRFALENSLGYLRADAQLTAEIVHLPRR
ncbi:MAG: metallophosphoesterase [Actinobacteria bacterium]|nr:MAG: metallophosphoesterase [Actinomycetota bacterium]